MRTRMIGKVLGASAALAAAIALSAGSALAWSGSQSYNHRADYTEGSGSSGGVAAAPRAALGGRYVASQDMYLHFGPNANSPKKLVIAAGTRLRVIGESVGGWQRVSSPTGIGWADSRYLAPG